MMTMMNDAERHEASNMGQYQAEDCDQETCESTRCACKQSNAKQDQGAVQSTAARDVLAERRRQIEAEGWTPEHDDAYAEGDLAQAAGCYSLYAHCSENLDGSPADWPWPDEWWKPAGPRRNLVKAGALILAEIERLDRAARAASTAKHGEAVEVVGYRFFHVDHGYIFRRTHIYEGNPSLEAHSLMTVAQHQRILAAATRPADQVAEGVVVSRELLENCADYMMGSASARVRIWHDQCRALLASAEGVKDE